MRRHLVVCAITLVSALSACSGDPTAAPPSTSTAASTSTPTASSLPPAAGTLTTFQLDDAGTSRRYDVYVPPAGPATEPSPVVVVLPGSNVTPEAMRELTAFDLLADTEGFLVVYVDARSEGLDNRLCCGGTDRDVDFVRAVLAEVGTTMAIDPDRVYATGFSAGAAMSYKLAVRAPDLFAAVAPVSGGFYPDPRVASPENTVPASAPSVIAFAGGVDPDYDDILGGLALWRRGAGCEADVETTVDGTADIGRTAAECADGSAVELYSLPDMGHAWPGGGGAQNFADRRSGLSATDLIWSFFTTHSRP